MNKDRMHELVTVLNEANYQYYVLDNPTISDAKWDALYDELKELEKSTGVVLDNSPTKQVGGATLSYLPEHKHINRLYSMDKVQSIEALKNWYNKCHNFYDKIDAKLPDLKFTVEYKLDGLTLNLTYNNSILQYATTRGNGIVGEQVYSQARTIKTINTNISYSDILEVQGECIMKLSKLHEYNKLNLIPLKNARNAAAGALRNLDPKETAKRNLDAFFYNIGTINNRPYSSQIELIDFLRKNGFDTSPYIKLCTTFNEIVDCINEIDNARTSLDFLIDGVVIKINDIDTREYYGYTEKFPKWAIAYKFEAQEDITRLKNVTWEVGRTGKLTPLAHLETVEIGGVSINKATLNNYSDIKRKKLSLGCDVWIRRSNDVIPEILGRVSDEIDYTKEEEILPPAYCPYCNSILYFNGAHLYCPGGKDCKPQVIAKINHFCSRDAMDIEGLSIKTAEALFDNGLVHGLDDIYKLNYNDLLNLEGFKEKKSESLINEIEKSKNTSLYRFIFALGILNVGLKTAKDLQNKFKSLDAILNASYDDLTSIDEIGDAIAYSILDFFSSQDNINMIKRMLELGLKVTNIEKATNTQTLLGSTFVLTGTLNNLTRKEAENIIKENGGNVSSSVSKNTTYLLLGDNPGSKYEKAKKIGVTIISEEDLLNMIK